MDTGHQTEGYGPLVSNGAISLHLPDLQIKGFRAFDDLTISRLGRVNLFAGENSVGKTTVLEAVRLYAARGRYRVLEEILATREELTLTIDSDGDRVFLIDWDSLFHASSVGVRDSVSIGPKNSKSVVRISFSSFDPEIAGQLALFARARSIERSRSALDFQDARMLNINVGDHGYYIPISPNLNYRHFDRFLDSDSDLPNEIPSATLGPNLPKNDDIERFWDKLVEEKGEYRGVDALDLILHQKINDILLVAGTSQGLNYQSRRAVVGFENQSHRVPLKSLGDGAVRVFGIGVAIAYSRGGILIVDEAENGIHHDRQRDLWKMIFETARDNDVQIFATTHSWDCVHAFAKTASECDEAEGVLVRLERDEETTDIVAREYSDVNLRVAAEQGIEVR